MEQNRCQIPMTIADLISEINDLARIIVARSERPYTIGVRLMGAVSDHLTDDGLGAVAVPIYRIWAALTDRVDFPTAEPRDEGSASETMVRAATEWLAASATESSRAAYFDRWLYEECGYQP